MTFLIPIPVLIVLFSSFPAFGQEPVPAVLSREVQLFVQQQLKLPQRSDWQAYVHPGRSTAWALDPPFYVAYDDTLTVFDIIALQRAETQGRPRPSDIDYQAAATAWCWWPNKPPSSEAVRPTITKVRASVVGVYFLAKKRAALRNAMGPLLRTGSPDDISGFLTQATAEDYAKQIVDPQKLQ